MLKFPTINGIRVVDGAQTLILKTYQVAISIQSKQRPVAPNTYKVVPETSSKHDDWMEVRAVDYGYLTGTIKLGSKDRRDEFF